MTVQALYLGCVIAAFTLFAATLMIASVWTKRGR
jgi:hypothetical protein